MQQEGYLFYLSENQVWLSQSAAMRYIGLANIGLAKLFVSLFVETIFSKY
jgi:RNA:NAD 2'-phosphotransferase (TPT1/KptA family)